MKREGRRLWRRPKYCISIGGSSIQILSRKLERARSYKPDLIELRLDFLMDIDATNLERICPLLRGNEILTLRARAEGGRSSISEKNRINLIEKVILPLRPAFVDVEISTLRRHPKLLGKIKASGTSLIASFHDLKGKLTERQLEKIASSVALRGNLPYVVKIVSQARSLESNLKLLGLYSSEILKKKINSKLVAFCTGKLGIYSRLLSLFALSPFGYVSLPGDPVAEGQMDIESARALVRGS